MAHVRHQGPSQFRQTAMLGACGSFTQYSPHFTQYFTQYTQYLHQFTQYFSQFTQYLHQFTEYSPQFPQHLPQFTTFLPLLGSPPQARIYNFLQHFYHSVSGCGVSVILCHIYHSGKNVAKIVNSGLRTRAQEW